MQPVEKHALEVAKTYYLNCKSPYYNRATIISLHLDNEGNMFIILAVWSIECHHLTPILNKGLMIAVDQKNQVLYAENPLMEV